MLGDAESGPHGGHDFAHVRADGAAEHAQGLVYVLLDDEGQQKTSGVELSGCRKGMHGNLCGRV